MCRNLFLLVISAALLFAGCKKEESTAPAADPEPPVSFDLSIDGAQGVRMLLDGQEVTISESPQTNLQVYSNAGGVEEAPPLISNRVYSAYLRDGNIKVDVFGMTIGTLEYLGPDVIPEDLYGFFVPGNRALAPASIGTDGVELSWVDASGASWSTACASGSQTNSSFLITEVENGMDGELTPYVTVKATFTAQFYNCATGAVMSATNGVLVMRFREFA